MSETEASRSISSPEWSTHHRVIFAPGLFAPQLVKAKIGDDPVNPRIKRAFEAEVSDVPESLQKRLLVNVFRIVLAAGQVQRQPQNLVLILPHKGVEGHPRAGLRLADQFHLLGADLLALLRPSLAPSRPVPPIALVAAIPAEDCTFRADGQAKPGAITAGETG